jgi:hypothetical protein
MFRNTGILRVLWNCSGHRRKDKKQGAGLPEISLHYLKVNHGHLGGILIIDWRIISEQA